MEDAQAKPAVAKFRPLLLIKVLRPRQWTKNLIAVLPLMFSGHLNEPDKLVSVLLTVGCLCLVSGSIYVANDIKDRAADAKHPTKKKRPIAAGLISPQLAGIVAVFALLTGLAGGFLVKPMVALVLCLYVLLQVFYNLVLKQLPILDCFSIATGFVLRAVAGGVAASVALSGWFLICTSLGSLWLAIEKRRSELKVLGTEADGHRKSLDKYSMELITRMETVIVPSLVTCYAMYCYFWQSPELTNAPVAPSGWMLITVPFVLYGIFRYQLLSTTADVTGSPEEVLLKDRPIQIAILLWVLVAAGVVYDVIPQALKNLDLFMNSLGAFKQ